MESIKAIKGIYNGNKMESIKTCGIYKSKMEFIKTKKIFWLLHYLGSSISKFSRISIFNTLAFASLSLRFKFWLSVTFVSLHNLN
jgi:hypothetical protein